MRPWFGKLGEWRERGLGGGREFCVCRSRAVIGFVPRVLITLS